MIIGITGTDGAGKGTVVEYLVNEKGFAHYSARSLFIEEIERRGLSVDRAHMRLIANDLRKINGNNYIAKEFIKRAKDAGDENVVIESIRASAEVDYLKEHGGILLAVDADQRVRYERVVDRASESDSISFAEFVEHEALEMNDPDPHGLQKAAVIAAADHTIQNNGDVEELHKQIDALLKSLS